MLISLKWLNEYIDVSDMSAQNVADTLTDLGLEVEGIETIAALPEGLVIGKIISAEPHPNADSLQKCKVDIGQAEPVDIVCGAPNARVGLTAAVATLGTVLPGDFKIKPAKIRGEASSGMMCSQKELKISEEDAGLWEIETEQKPGTPVSEFFNTADAILDVSLTPNRADCLSYIGIARDLSAKLNRPLKKPTHDLTSLSELKLKSSSHIKVEVEGDLSLRFCAIAIRDIEHSLSPMWMQNRLLACGMRPISMIVDITNYVLLETGQPIHAYDDRFLEENTIRVRLAKEDDKLTTLDGNQAKLTPEDILICDGKKPVGLAGVMGGENSEVKDDTQHIIVEVAEFSPARIRKTSKRLGLHTEASHRFERGIDIGNIKDVAIRVADLLVKCSEEMGLAKPKVASEIVEYYPDPKPLSRIALQLKSARRMLAMPLLTVETCIKHLEGLGIKLLDKKDERMLFEIPSWRKDIVREVDLIEEVARIEGFDKIPYEQPRMIIAPTKEKGLIWFTEELKQQMALQGLSEIITFPFVSKKLLSEFNINEGHPFWPSIALANPISEEFEYMQTTLTPGLMHAVKRNRNRGSKGSKLFEVGRSYFDFNTEPLNKNDFPTFSEHDRKSTHYTPKAQGEEKRPVERQFLSCVLDAPFVSKSWNSEEEIPNFYHIKNIVYRLMHSLGINNKLITLERPTAEELPFLHPGASALLKWEGKLVGWMGEANPRVAEKLGFNFEQAPVVAEIDMEYLYEMSQSPIEINADSSKFPPVTRDLALLVEKNVTHGMFDAAFKNFKANNLKSVNLFDIYAGENIPEDKRSFAYTASFQSLTKTLTDKEVDKEVTSLIKWLEDQLQAEQR